MTLPGAILRGGSDGRCCAPENSPAILALENWPAVVAPEDSPPVLSPVEKGQRDSPGEDCFPPSVPCHPVGSGLYRGFAPGPPQAHHARSPAPQPWGRPRSPTPAATGRSPSTRFRAEAQVSAKPSGEYVVSPKGLPPSGYSFTVTVFTSVYACKPYSPSSRPMPERLNPPKGAAASKTS